MLKLVGILSLVTVALAAVSIYSPEEKPPQLANQEGCYNSLLPMVVPYDQPTYRHDICAKLQCDRTTGETREETCGAVALKDGCTLSDGDLSKNYPDCCGQEVCPTTTQAPTTQAPTTQAPTTQAPTTQAPTTQAPTTQAPTTQAPTTQAPASQAPPSQGSVAFASAKSGGGQAPVTETYTSGPGASATATAS